MGRLEKIVVLTVLFLVAVILGVSLNQGGGPLEPAPQEVLAGAPEQPAADPAALAAAEETGPSGALFSGTRSEEAAPLEEAGEQAPAPQATEPPEPATQEPATAQVEPPAPAVVTPPPSGDEGLLVTTEGRLVTTEGLSEGLVPDVMIYAWAEGDSFKGLAERYFGSALEVGRMRKANEGRDEAKLQAGDRIFVPVRANEPTERLTRNEQAAGQWSGGVYHVEAGDMLGLIAQKVYGSASKWRLIYEANRDVLASPDALQVGMALRIPRID